MFSSFNNSQFNFRNLCLEGTTDSQRRLVTGYEVPGIWDIKERCLEGSTSFPLQGSGFQPPAVVDFCNPAASPSSMQPVTKILASSQNRTCET